MDADTRARAGGAGVADPLTGQVLNGRYRIGPRIARGGMASVYETLDIRLERTCAVKIMHPGLGDDTAFADRFTREARAAARLSHPNVVSVFDQGEDPDVDGGTLYLVMELVPGHTLRDVIRGEAPMNPAKAIAVIEPVVSALAAAHRSGLVHRDIKPENVLIAPDGRVKVADFGLAKAVSADTQHTATGGVIIGTVSYLAPELVIDGTCDARADVYAAGVVLYELLTGDKPHAGESPIAVAYKHVHEDVPAPSATVSGIPPYVDALVARATARDRAQRPADAGVLLHQIHRVSQALAGQVWDDAELTADLALPAPVAPAELTAPVVPVSHDTHALDLLPMEPAEYVAPVEQAPGAGDAVPPPPGLPQIIHPAPAAGPRRSRRGPALLVVALVLALAAGLGAYWFGWARYTAAPGVIGMTQQAATAKLDHAGFDVAVGDPAFSETVAKGRVITTDPQPGARVLDHGTITLTVSQGRERFAVPKLRGLTVDRAQDALLAQHLTFGRSVGRWSENIPKGQVLGSNPAAGRRERRSTAVDLLVSKGPAPIRIKDWTGRPATRAEQALQAVGLQVDAGDQEFSDTVPEGAVITQDPAHGVLHRGDTVSLTVSKGPELVQVPGDLRAQGVEAARTALENLGFHVEVVHSDIYLGLGFVAGSDPTPGSMAPRGSTVTLQIV